MNLKVLACTALAFMTFACGAGAGEPKSSIRTPTRTDLDGSVHMRFHADKSFTVPQQAAIMLATALWYQQTGGQVTITAEFDLVTDRIGEANVILAGDVSWLIRTKRSLTLLGLTQGNMDYGLVTMVFITDNFNTDPGITRQWTTTALHEFGHALGMKHTKPYKTVMYKEVGDASPACLTAEDLVEFCKVRQCGFYALNPCKE